MAYVYEGKNTYTDSEWAVLLRVLNSDVKREAAQNSIALIVLLCSD